MHSQGRNTGVQGSELGPRRQISPSCQERSDCHSCAQIRGDGISSLLLECGLRLHEHLGDVIGFRYRAEAGPGDSQDLLGSWNLRTHPADLEPESCEKGAGVHRQSRSTGHQAGRPPATTGPKDFHGTGGRSRPREEQHLSKVTQQVAYRTERQWHTLRECVCVCVCMREKVSRGQGMRRPIWPSPQEG